MDIPTNWAIWVTIITVLVFIYKYMTKNFGYWESIGVPCEKGYFLIGSEISMFKKPLHEIDIERTKKHGRFYGTYILTGRTFNVTDPELIKLILIKDFPAFVNRQLIRSGQKFLDLSLTFAVDDDWKRVRSVISPTFSSGKIRKMTAMVKNIAMKLTHHVAELTEKEQPVNVKNEIAKFSAEVLGACAFGIEFDAFKNPNHPFLINTKKVFQGGVKSLLFYFLIVLLPKIMDPIRNKVIRGSSLTFFKDLAEEVIDKRRAIVTQENKPVDFLQLMLDAKNENAENLEPNTRETNGVTVESTEKKPQWTKTLDEDEIIAQCFTFLFAGYDTISSAIAFVAYNLARHQDIQETLFHEVDDVWEKFGDPDYDTVNKMTYLNAVISETLRIQSVTIRLTRQVRENYQIPNTNIVIPKNAIVSIPVYALHHDPEFFPNPEKFDPDRFLPENKDNIKPYTYLPFADGPRNCVAMRFAQMEMKFCLAYILRYIKFLPAEEPMKPLKFVNASVLLMTKDGIILRTEKRRPL